MGDEKVAVVTGANKGLGYSIVKGLCEKFKGTVFLTSRDDHRGREACTKLQKLGYAPKYHQLDVTDNESVSKFCSYIRSPNKKIQILVNNAGVLFLKDAKESKSYQAEQTVLVNFFALVDFTEAILPFISDHGTILNISSSSGHLSRIPSKELREQISDTNLSLEGLKSLMREYVDSVKLNKNIEDGWGESSYVVSKVGVNAYTFMLNRKLVDRGILVNCVHPGYVMTDMTHGVGSISPDDAAEIPLKVVFAEAGGLYVWHNGEAVSWDGPDPREFIDGFRKFGHETMVSKQ